MPPTWANRKEVHGAFGSTQGNSSACEECEDQVVKPEEVERMYNMITIHKTEKTDCDMSEGWCIADKFVELFILSIYVYNIHWM